jgi:hypothetical protein
MADGFEHETERVNPEAREIWRRVLRELLGLVKNLVAQVYGAAVDSMHG